MTNLVRSLNKLENILITLGANKESAEDAIESLIEVYENKLATKDDMGVLRSEIELVRGEIKSLEKRLDLLTTIIVVSVVALFVQNLIR